ILYRTGDLGRYRPDGNVEFAGRQDHQVKIRGYRIEPAEIEAAVARHPGVRAALVRPYESESIEKCLVAYIVPEQGRQPGASELRNHVSRLLPDYMVPASYVFVDAFPLTPNGKLDLKMLPAPQGTRPEINQEYVAPQAPVEEALAQIWLDLLRIDRVGIHDNFFEIGGHSLMATRLLSQIRLNFNIELPLRGIFEKTTIASL